MESNIRSSEDEQGLRRHSDVLTARACHNSGELCADRCYGGSYIDITEVITYHTGLRMGISCLMRL